MGRKCSHCGNIGHNTRTCTSYKGRPVCGGGVRLFGVQLDLSSSSSSSSSSAALKKSFSMNCLSSSSHNSSPSPSTSSRVSINEIPDKARLGYISDGLLGHCQERKKGVPWTEEEHRTFLIGLEKLGKGDWRGISRNFVTSRTPTQVASHAQKYFLRQASLDKKKRRSSLFDMVRSSNMGHQQPKSSDYKSGDSNPVQHRSTLTTYHEEDSHLLDEETNYLSEWPSDHYQFMTLGLFGSSNAKRSAEAITSNEAPDLELTLAAPEPKINRIHPLVPC